MRCDSALKAARGAQALVLLTEWPEFREIPTRAVKAAMAGSLVVDAKGVWAGREDLEREGILYRRV